MSDINNLKVYTCVVSTCDSDGQPIKGTEHEVCVLFNQTQISIEEVDKLFDDDTWKYNPRVTPVTKQQLEMLRDKKKR